MTSYLMVYLRMNMSVLRVAHLYLRLKLMVHLSLKLRVALEDAHDGALVSARECVKQFNKK